MFPVGINNFSSVFTLNGIIVYVCMAVLNGILLFYASLKFLLVFQQCGYKTKRFYAWLKKPETPYRNRLMLLCLLGFLFFCVLTMCFSPVFEVLIGEATGYTYVSYLGFIAYLFFVIFYIITERPVNAKVSLKRTKRMIRLSIVYVLFLSALSFGFILLLNYISFLINDTIVGLLRYSLICFLPMLLPFLMATVSTVISPIENAINKRYIKNASEKLEKTRAVKIAITGSFGKTSVKEILTTVLSEKYKVMATPLSYNTPLGISLAVNGLDDSYDYFVAEFGARQKGDIKQLCDMVKPTVGVLTGVNEQHLESFVSLDNVISTKNELFENLSDNGTAFFSSDNEHSLTLADKFNGEKYISGINGKDGYVYATDIKTTKSGTDFTLVINGKEKINCFTLLLGRHSISNICLASAVAYKLGLSKEEIALGISKIKPIKHRLEIVSNDKDIVIIDDSYNSNYDGINASLEVLNLFEGRKIVVTPGLVELGNVEKTVNYEFGKKLSGNAQIVVVVGKHNKDVIEKGLIDGGLNKENVIFARTLNKAKEKLNTILEKGDVVLFENDLPDNYS